MIYQYLLRREGQEIWTSEMQSHNWPGFSNCLSSQICRLGQPRLCSNDTAIETEGRSKFMSRNFKRRKTRCNESKPETERDPYRKIFSLKAALSFL